MQRYHATSVLSLTARPGTGCDGTRLVRTLRLISRDLSLAAPLHFLSDLREDVDARSFSEGDAARPTTASQPSGAHDRLARSRLARPLFFVVKNRDRPAIAG